MKNDPFTIIFHTLIALFLLPAYEFLGEGFKYVVAPYVIYMIWMRNPAFLPALFIHFTPGSTMSFLILVAVLGVTILNVRLFISMRLGWVLVFTFLPFPIFAYQTAVRIISHHASLIETLIPMGYYLGLFPFFYGILLLPKFNNANWKSLIVVLALLPFLKLVPFLELNPRAYWLSFPLCFALLGSTVLYPRCFRFEKEYIILSAVLLIGANFGGLGLKFTLIFSGCLALLAVIVSLRRQTFLLKLITLPRAIVLLTVIVVGMVVGVDRFGGMRNLRSFDPHTASYFIWDDFWNLLQYKAFDDRAVLWAGGWDLVVKRQMIWPPYKAPSYSFVAADGRLVDDITFGIHNIALELMRNYGIVIGVLITLAYGMMLVKGPGKCLFRRFRQKYLAVFSGACLGAGWVGGLVGQHVLVPTLSFLLLSICGILFGYTMLYNKMGAFRNLNYTTNVKEHASKAK